MFVVPLFIYTGTLLGDPGGSSLTLVDSSLCFSFACSTVAWYAHAQYTADRHGQSYHKPTCRFADA